MADVEETPSQAARRRQAALRALGREPRQKPRVFKADGKVYRPRRADAVINQPRLLSVNTALLDALISLLFALPNPTEEQISTAKTAVSSALKELA